MEHTPDGILLIDKAEGWTSHDVVARSRRALGTRKVGHAGTLDPMATGLLILGAGPSTRLLTHLVGLDKEYTATIRLGQSTITDDREGEAVARAEVEIGEVSQRIRALAEDPSPIRRVAATLTGAIEQAPSAVSAIKVDGRRAYDRVRSGESVELPKRPVTVHAFELSVPELGSAASGEAVLDLEATVHCSSGTYIRALARDLGAALGVGGHLTALRRTAVGPISVAEALPTAGLSADRDGDPAIDASALHSPAAIASRLFPVLELTPEQTIDLGHGKRLEVDPTVVTDAPVVAALAPGGRLVGLVAVKGGRVRVVTNFPVSTPELGGGA